MTKLKRKPQPPPQPDMGLFTLEEVAQRHKLNREITHDKLKRAGVPCIRLSAKVLRFRVSDILKFEADCTTIGPSADQLAKVEAMKRGAAAKKGCR